MSREQSWTNIMQHSRIYSTFSRDLMLAGSGSAAYLNNHLIHDFCENRKKPTERSCFHPAWCVRKCAGLLELVSGTAPATSTRPKTTKDGKGRVKNAPSIGRKEEVKLVYKMIEPYFVALRMRSSISEQGD
jgi:hypothetical protein